MSAKKNIATPPAIEIDCRDGDLQNLAELEWLAANSRGSYACGTVLGSNTRRYHGLLVSATQAPVGRQVMLSTLREEVFLGTKRFDISSFMFPNAVSPEGFRHLVKFVNEPVPTWTFNLDGVEFQRQVVLSESRDIVAVRYRCESSGPVRVHAWPFGTIRDFHDLRRRQGSDMLTFSRVDGGVRIELSQQTSPPLWVVAEGGQFHEDHQWWLRFQYFRDLQRGQEGLEDIPTPGYVGLDLPAGRWASLLASTEKLSGYDAEKTVAARARRIAKAAESVGPKADELTRRLAVASDIFTVGRRTQAGDSQTILAGFPWFADWGRDAFIALPGLLLNTGRFQQARAVLDTFAHAVSKGMIPNRFDDYGGKPHYNSMDASLWFIVAADRYVRASGDDESWRQEFAGAARAIAEHYHDGTRFGIHADSDGLLTGGAGDTQLTWMDVKFNGEAITPRQGKAVEINALWVECLTILAQRCGGDLADRFGMMASNVGREFVERFWNAEGGYLYDCIGPEGPDASLRPNQLIAAALPSVPLSREQRRSIVELCAAKLLTPRGLRTLSPEDGRYRARYGGSWESRDRAYHQGTVWPWLMGPMVQALLVAEDFSDQARQRAAEWLDPFNDHLREAALGQINEIFDGVEPHLPRGCVAQAWSVAEVLRAKIMVRNGKIY